MIHSQYTVNTQTIITSIGHCNNMPNPGKKPPATFRGGVDSLRSDKEDSWSREIINPGFLPYSTLVTRAPTARPPRSCHTDFRYRRMILPSPASFGHWDRSRGSDNKRLTARVIEIRLIYPGRLLCLHTLTQYARSASSAAAGTWKDSCLCFAYVMLIFPDTNHV